ncbi:hypothetical protein PUG46_19440 [Erwiniaceae bacterium L1_55_4]|nr:hypothetical protein [Erwiniaceae bacterium L1_55_4]
MSEVEICAIVAGSDRHMALAITPCGTKVFWFYDNAWHLTSGEDPDFNCQFFQMQSQLAIYLPGGRKTYRGIFKIKVPEGS